MTYDLSDKVCIAEKVEERVTEVMAGMSRRWKKTGGIAVDCADFM